MVLVLLRGGKLHFLSPLHAPPFHFLSPPPRAPISCWSLPCGCAVVLFSTRAVGQSKGFDWRRVFASYCLLAQTAVPFARKRRCDTAQVPLPPCISHFSRLVCMCEYCVRRCVLGIRAAIALTDAKNVLPLRPAGFVCLSVCLCDCLPSSLVGCWFDGRQVEIQGP